MNAIVFVRPTAENIHALRVELRDPHYASYKLIFSNLVRRSHVEEIADADEFHLVSELREVFVDYLALNSTTLSCDVCPCLHIMMARHSPALHNPGLDRATDAVLSSLLAMKRRPSIRFQRNSPLCRAIAQRMCVKMDQERSLFEFRQQDVPLLLLLDRREDPVTPLLNQWTYEAMIHELIGIKGNRVSLRDAPNVPQEFRELVLDHDEDEFFQRNRFCNFGDLGVNLKGLVDSFQKQSKSTTDLSTIEHMSQFVASYPEFRKSSSNVSKHVALAGELSRLVGQMNLLQVSELEQDIACREAESDHRREIMALLQKGDVTKSDKLRLVMLYGLRYEGTGDKGLPLMKDALHRAGLGSDGIHLITAVKEYAGAAKRSGDVFSNRSFLAVASNKMRRGIGGVDNIYTQHEPLLMYTLDDLFRNKMKNQEFPLARPEGDTNGNSGIDDSNALYSVPPPRELLIVIAGGATYEESKCVSAINGGKGCFVPLEGSTTASAAAAARQLNAQIVLMGTCIQNSTSFAVEITQNANAQRQDHFVRPAR